MTADASPNAGRLGNNPTIINRASKDRTSCTDDCDDNDTDTNGYVEGIHDNNDDESACVIDVADDDNNGDGRNDYYANGSGDDYPLPVHPGQDDVNIDEVETVLILP